MEIYEAVEKLKALIIKNNLPKTEMALFGIKCPYCGKSDRIHKLESPADLNKAIGTDDLQLYSDLWVRLNPFQKSLGTCKFCLNPVELILDKGSANTLTV